MKRLSIQVLKALGWQNLLRIISYRVRLRLGIHPVQHTYATVQTGPFFGEVTTLPCQASASKKWQKSALYFGWFQVDLNDKPPHWHRSPLTGKNVSAPELPWWKILDFDTNVGDIKEIWEASRFSWVLACAQRARQNDICALKQLNAWLDDWCHANPPYRGTNWKCGQEASIRVLHLAMAALVLNQIKTVQPALISLIDIHLRRIAPTIHYAVAQDNNHGTSEAAALFIGGSWLAMQGHSQGSRWAKQGRSWLENRVAHLIEVDGSFSQYSITYHRLVLDTLCMVEIWRRKFKLPEFSSAWKERTVAAAYWLYNMVDVATGDAPNLGANDGALILSLVDTDYRDFRPTVQLSMTLFTGQCAYASEDTWDVPLFWLDIPKPAVTIAPQQSQVFDKGGYAVLRHKNTMALLRYPRFHFRPSQADALHVDFWRDGLNVLRDAGTYSYHTSPDNLRYFAGTESHNTIQFDARDQMPRLSRFLFGNWLKTTYTSGLIKAPEQISFAAAYQDGEKVRHQRQLTLTNTSFLITDDISGFKRKAVLRWRLLPGTWTIQGHSVSNGTYVLHIKAAMPIVRLSLVNGWESLYYLHKQEIPVLEVEFHQSGKLVSELSWN